MAEILDSDDDSVCDLTEPEVIDLSADDTDLAAQLNAQLDEYIVIDSDSEDDVQFVSQSPPKRRKTDDDDVTFVKSTPPARPVHDVDADEALARKLHEQINGDVEVVARPAPASKPAKKTKKRPKNEGPFGGRDVLKKQRTGLFDFLSKKAKSLRIVDVVPNPHSEPGKPLYERFLSAYTFAKTKKVKLLFHGSPSQAVHKSDCHDLHAIDAAPIHWLIYAQAPKHPEHSGQRPGPQPPRRVVGAKTRQRRVLRDPRRGVHGVLRRRAPDDCVCRADGSAVDARGREDRRVERRVAPAPALHRAHREPDAAPADGARAQGDERGGASTYPQGAQARLALRVRVPVLCE